MYYSRSVDLRSVLFNGRELSNALCIFIHSSSTIIGPCLSSREASQRLKNILQSEATRRTAIQSAGTDLIVCLVSGILHNLEYTTYGHLHNYFYSIKIKLLHHNW